METRDFRPLMRSQKENVDIFGKQDNRQISCSLFESNMSKDKKNMALFAKVHIGILICKKRSESAGDDVPTNELDCIFSLKRGPKKLNVPSNRGQFC